MEFKNGIPIIKASSGIIQCKPDKPFSDLEISLLFLTLGHAYDNLLKKRTHRIRADLLDEFFGFKGNNWDRYNKAFMKLQTTLVSWNIHNYGKSNCSEYESWARVQYLGRIGWDSNTKEFFYSYDEQLAKHLYKPEFYALLSGYIMTKKLKGAATKMLYAHCRLYVSCPHGTRQYSIPDLKNLLQIPQQQYSSFKKLNNQVLKPAIKKINAASDIYIEVLFIKMRRKVEKIKFKIKNNPGFNKALDETKGKIVNENEFSNETNKLLSLLVEKYGIRKEKAFNLIKEYAEARILAGLNYVVNKPGHKPNVSGYIITAIEQNYAANKTPGDVSLVRNSDNKSNHKKRVDKKQNMQDNISVQECERVVALIKNNYFNYCVSLIKAKLYKLDDSQLKKFLDEFKEKHLSILNSLNKKYKIFRKNTNDFLDFICEQSFRLSFCAFYVKKFPEIKKEITAFNYFINGADSYQKKCYRQLTKIDPEKCKIDFLELSK